MGTKNVTPFSILKDKMKQERRKAKETKTDTIEDKIKTEQPKKEIDNKIYFHKIKYRKANKDAFHQTMLNKVLNTYHCGYCQFDFQRYVGSVGARIRMRDAGGQKGSNCHVSSQVKCPRCQNGLKTWGDSG